MFLFNLELAKQTVKLTIGDALLGLSATSQQYFSLRTN
jgi:hypothetical protein